MYLGFYNLKDQPFQITCDPKYLWLSDTHREGLALLRHGLLNNPGFVLLTGEVGTGKTLLINHLFTLFSKDIVAVTVMDPDLNPNDFYRLLADGFKLPFSVESKAAFLIEFRKFLLASVDAKKRVILIIDEAHRLNHRIMEDLRTLSNIEFPDKKLITFFLVGQPELNQILGCKQNRALSQCITMHHQIEPLDPDETARYIQHRLSVAGGSKRVFGQSAIKQIYAHSTGIPRLINILCDRALLTGSIYNIKQVGADIIDQCALGLRIPTRHKNIPNFRYASKLSELKSCSHKNELPLSDEVARLKKDEALVRSHGFPRMYLQKKRPVMAMVATIVIAVALLGIIFTKQADLNGYHSGMIDSHQRNQTRGVELSNMVNDEEIPSPTPKVDMGITAHGHTNPTVGYDIPAREPAVQEIQDHSSEESESLVAIGWPERKNVPIAFNPQDEIEVSSFADIDKVADDLITFPERMVYVHGYAKANGPFKKRQIIWRKRVGALRSYFTQKGVSLYQIRLVDMDTRRIEVPLEMAKHRYAVIELPSNHYAIHYNHDK